MPALDPTWSSSSRRFHDCRKPTDVRYALAACASPLLDVATEHRITPLSGACMIIRSAEYVCSVSSRADVVGSQGPRARGALMSLVYPLLLKLYFHAFSDLM